MRGESDSLAPGSRALAAVLLIGLVGVLVGRAIWAGDDPASVPGAPPVAAPAESPGEQGSGSDINSLISGTGTDLASCVRDAGGTPAPADPRQATDQDEFITILSGQLQQLRGLGFDHPVDAEFLPGPKIEKRISELVDSEPAPAGESAAGGKLLAALGAIQVGDDPEEIQRKALQGQVAGLYVPKTEELLVRSGKDIGINDTITVVHELDHALTDQALGGIREKFGPQPNAAERSSAYTAVVEGDATIAMYAYLLRHGSFDDQLDSVSELGPANKAQDQLETFPYYFQRQLLYPYVEGLSFDCALLEKGGWKAIDEAYAKPPKTTAEVMFPERYGEKAATPPEPGILREPWKKTLGSTIGAADLDWLFSAPGDDTSKALDDPRAAARLWRAGIVQLWEKGDDSAVSVALEDREEGLGLCRAVEQWYGAFGGTPQENDQGPDGLVARFDGEDSQAYLSCEGREVRLGIAPAAMEAEALGSAPPGIAQ